MYNYALSQIFGGLTLFMMVISYFFKSKSSYLICQTIGLGRMFLSYLFGAQSLFIQTLGTPKKFPIFENIFAT